MRHWNWERESVDEEYLAWHAETAQSCRRDIVQMTHLANSGHPGGSLSSLDFYLVMYAHANIDPQRPWFEERDRIVVSHGHTSPGVYSVLARLGYFPPEEVIARFRRTNHVFEGHIEREVPGVEWTTGNLGQGLSAACGMALGHRLKGISAQLYVPMGDGEQQKGQISEARRLAVKFGLNSITSIVDCNRLQIGGATDEIMPQDIAAGWASDGWKVVEVDGHDPVAIHQAMRAAVHDEATPHVLIANSIMGKGFAFMEDIADFHGRAANDDEYQQCITLSGESPEAWDLEPLRQRIAASPVPVAELPTPYPKLSAGTPRTYPADKRTDNRSAFGNALFDVAEANATGGAPPVAVFDCDLEGSVKTTAFRKAYPNNFFEAGIQEHNTATAAGALSVDGIVSVFADFGVFGIAETYNQHRLSDINHAHVKVACTHVGLDVGEDGKTHQCIDYVGVLHNIFGMQVLVPADPNQTDRAVRHMLTEPGMFTVAMGRSKLPTILGEDGTPFFGDGYEFRPGQGDWIRSGKGGAVVVMGTLTGRALDAVEELRSSGSDVALAHLATPTEIAPEFLDALAQQPFIATVEDHSVRTGLGACLASAMFARGHAVPHLRLGVEKYAPSGSAEAVYRAAGLDAEGIRESVRKFAQSCAR